MKRKVSQKQAEKAVTTLLHWIGEDPERAGLLETPRRVALALQDLTSGYRVELDQVLGHGFDCTPSADQPIILNHIPLQSICEHHLLPITGTAHIAYLPGPYIIGVSKLVRLVDALARRLQVQETLTDDIADALQRYLRCRGCGVVLQAAHACIALRGARSVGTSFRTQAFRGAFTGCLELRQVFLQTVDRSESQR